MKYILNIILWFIVALLMNACQKDENLENPINDKTVIATKVLANGNQLSILSDGDFQIGYKNIYVKIEKDGKAINPGNISLVPTMDMGTMQHGAPNGPLTFDSNSGFFKGYVVFTMASGESGSWTLNLKIADEEVSVPILVKEALKGNVPVKTFTANDNKRYVIALVEPNQPKIGMNDLEVMIFLRESMYSYPVQDDLTLDFTPEMTSMEHGSPNNQNPTGLGKGRYVGKVNFTMTGDWRLFFNINKANVKLAEEVFLDVLF